MSSGRYSALSAGIAKLQRPDGSFYYTRLGSFHRDGDGDLASANGWKVMNDQNRPITIPEAPPPGI